MNETDPSYNDTKMDYNFNDAWLYYKSLAALVESHYPQFVQMDEDYLTELNRYYRARVEEVIAGADGKSGEELTAYLTKANQETVAHTKQDSEKLWGQMFTEAINLSKLTFNMDKNL
jgi:dipeptidase